MINGSCQERTDYFKAGRCYRDYYYGEIHFYLKASLFLKDSLNSGDACAFISLWESQLKNYFKKFNFDVEGLLQKGQLLFAANQPPVNGNPAALLDLYFSIKDQQSNSPNPLPTIRVFHHVAEYNNNWGHSSAGGVSPYLNIYQDRGFSEMSKGVEHILHQNKVFVFFLCNFEAYLTHYR